MTQKGSIDSRMKQSVAPGHDYDDENKQAKKSKLFHDETPKEVKVSDCQENSSLTYYSLNSRNGRPPTRMSMNVSGC